MPLDQVIGSRDGDSWFLFLGSGGGEEEEREGAGEVRFVGGGSAEAVVAGRGASLGSYCSAWSSGSTISSWQR